MAIGVGTSTVINSNTTTSFTLVINSGVAAGNLLVLAAVNRDATANPTVTDNDVGGNTWTMLASQNAATNGAISVWWKRATANTASKTITVSGMTGSSCGGVTPFTGASIATTPTTGPFSGTTPVGESNASGNEGQAEITTARAGSMVFLVVGCTSNDTLNVTTQAATDPSSLTERFEATSSGGSDCSISLASALKTTAGATGAFSWAQTNGTGASLAFALLPLLDSLDATTNQTYTVSGTAATLKRGYRLSSESGTFIETGSAASLSKPLQAEPAAFVLNGIAAGLRKSWLPLGIGSETFLVSGSAATLTYTPLAGGGGKVFVMPFKKRSRIQLYYQRSGGL